MTSSILQRQRGLSLVELMVAMALSLLLMLGVIQIFLSSKQTYNTNNALSRVQESGRFAIQLIVPDIRNAGYKGQCLGEPNRLLDTTDDMFSLSDPVEGWEGSENEQHTHLTGKSRRAGTDSIFVKFAAGTGNFNGDNNNATSTPKLGVTETSTGISAGTITLVSDALGCDIFQNTNNEQASVLQQSGGNVEPGNKGKDSAGNYWSHNYTDEMEILTLQNTLFYVRDNGGRPPSLVRSRLTVTGTEATFISEELVEGIQDMQIKYGITNGANKQVFEYRDADEVTNWENVAAVRIELLAVSDAANVTPENQIVRLNGTDVTIAERRLAQVFTSTIGIRNRLP